MTNMAIDPSAIPSLQRTALAALKEGPEVLRRLAGDTTSRRVVTSCIVARGGPWLDEPGQGQVLAWLSAVEAAQVRHVAGADGLAWAAYQAGKMDLARRWLDRAPAD